LLILLKIINDKVMNKLYSIYVFLVISISVNSQSFTENNGKPISPDLFGVFFEDLNYAADGGLYAELIQNRSFEYSPSDKDNWNRGSNTWNSFTAWEFATQGYGYGTISVETQSPVHVNNPHYILLNIEDEGSDGIGLKNSGFDGIVVKAGEKYDFSVFMRQVSDQPIPIQVKLVDKNGSAIGEASFKTQSKEWKKYTAVITATVSADSASLVVLAKTKGKLAIDVVSLFPQNTFMNRPNGLRADIAQTIASLKPKFMRFPGGCLVHGDGLGNMYRWKNTIGPVEQRVEQRSIWNYHQTVGLGYFEYFQFCEDIGAKPLPVVPAAVSCQNSGGTWRIGSIGQKAIPLNEMKDYVQEVLDLIEYANGPATSTWGAKRAEAGHPKPFNLEYIGIGNEDKQTPEFRERFKLIYDAIKTKHPEITVIGTVGPSPDGEDFNLGWKFAKELNVPMVDEHYYQEPKWLLSNKKRYDSYDRAGSKVYIGEYASWGNTWLNAISEAAYMTSVERNGDVVHMASYAPLLAKEGHTQWNPDLIYFNNTSVCPTVNYYVQQLFSTNQGDMYFGNIVSYVNSDSLVATSCVGDTKTGDVIIKLVNAGSSASRLNIDLSHFNVINTDAVSTILVGDPNAKNTFESPLTIIPKIIDLKVSKSFIYDTPAMSFTVIRVKTRK
jgi:alpha-L-arabinofuranosidase